jgi:hypothetical protein
MNVLARILRATICICHFSSIFKRSIALPRQKTEAWVSASALNTSTSLGMLVSVKI